jgi:hypothetical protein
MWAVVVKASSWSLPGREFCVQEGTHTKKKPSPGWKGICRWKYNRQTTLDTQ